MQLIKMSILSIVFISTISYANIQDIESCKKLTTAFNRLRCYDTYYLNNNFDDKSYLNKNSWNEIMHVKLHNLIYISTTRLIIKANNSPTRLVINCDAKQTNISLYLSARRLVSREKFTVLPSMQTKTFKLDSTGKILQLQSKISQLKFLLTILKNPSIELIASNKTSYKFHLNNVKEPLASIFKKCI